MRKVVIIDECVYSQKLARALGKNGIKYKYLGSGKSDAEIESYMNVMPNTVLITADIEFWTHFGWDRSLIVSSSDSVIDTVRVVKKFIE